LDTTSGKGELSFQIVSNQRVPAATAAADRAKSPHNPSDDDPIGSGGFITPANAKR